MDTYKKLKFKVGIFGLGYVGLAHTATMLNMGYKVSAFDIDKDKRDDLISESYKYVESDISNSIQKNKSLITYATSIQDVLLFTDIFFICVGTEIDNKLSITYIMNLLQNIFTNLSKKNNKICIIIRSTVPIGSMNFIDKYLKNTFNHPYDLYYNPEFLREGYSLEDSLNPSRIVIGSQSTSDLLKGIYRPILKDRAVIVSDYNSAELIKLASNSYIATKISFINTIADISEHCNANIYTVLRGLKEDKRIGRYFMQPGLGYGGSCIPKDTEGLYNDAKVIQSNKESISLLKSVIDVNQSLVDIYTKMILDEVNNLSDKIIAILGIGFKYSSSDLRHSKPIELINSLSKYKCTIRVYDKFIDTKLKIDNVEYISDSLVDTLKDVDLTIICNDITHLKDMNIDTISNVVKSRIIIDTMHLSDPILWKMNGWKYISYGYSTSNNIHI